MVTSRRCGYSSAKSHNARTPASDLPGTGVEQGVHVRRAGPVEGLSGQGHARSSSPTVSRRGTDATGSGPVEVRSRKNSFSQRMYLLRVVT